MLNHLGAIVRLHHRFVFAAAALTALSGAAFAQQPPPGAETKPPAEEPRWMQGRPPELKGSTLAPLAPHMAGRASKDLPLNTLKLPAGFRIEVFAEGIPDARSLALGAKDTVFVSNRNLRDIHAIVDRGGKREIKKILTGLDTPNGLAFRDGTLYVAEQTRILAYAGIEDNLDKPPQPRVVIDNLPKQPGHFWKFIAFGPDGKLYFNVGAPCNICLPNYVQGTISRVDVKTGQMEEYARGVRNSVGFDWHPQTKQLWFTDHGRDWLGDDMPSDELNRVSRQGEHFGFPYCHQGDTADPEFGKFRACSEFTPPVLKVGAHIAPLGMRFYTGSMFPAEYRNNMFIAMHGSWNRTIKQGYNVMRVIVDGNGKVTKYEPFLEGFLTDPKATPPTWGRPVDVMQMRDGSLLVTDDYNGIVYRISYAK